MWSRKNEVFTGLDGFVDFLFRRASWFFRLNLNDGKPQICSIALRRKLGGLFLRAGFEQAQAVAHLFTEELEATALYQLQDQRFDRGGAGDTGERCWQH